MQWSTAALLALGLLDLAGCRRPRTDIVATTTEDVGHFEVQSRVTNAGLTGRVCVEKPASTDEVVGRIVQQLANHNYSTISLDVYSPERPVARYVWTRSGQRQEA